MKIANGATLLSSFHMTSVHTGEPVGVIVVAELAPEELYRYVVAEMRTLADDHWSLGEYFGFGDIDRHERDRALGEAMAYALNRAGWRSTLLEEWRAHPADEAERVRYRAMLDREIRPKS